MIHPYLIVDVSYLSWRAFHVTGGLTYKEAGTGVIYGVLRSIQTLMNRFVTDKVIFAFDSGKSYRRDIYPQYKANRRKDQTPEQQAAYEDMKRQISLMKNRYLYDIGFRNIWWQRGFEADDIIAATCVYHNDDHSSKPFMIVSGDKDLFQCITTNVSVYNPIKDEIMDVKRFRAQYGILPMQWAEVKSIAGCKTDNIPGVKGVGDVTAIKYVRGDLVGNKKASIDQQKDNIRRTLNLVALPFCTHDKAVLLRDIEPDEVTPRKWRDVVSSLGMKSLKDSFNMHEHPK